MKQLAVSAAILAGIFLAVDYHNPDDVTVETFSLMFGFFRDVAIAFVS